MHARPQIESSALRRPGQRYGWISDAFDAAYEVFDSPQMASAAALIGASSRIIVTASGSGVDAAAFGASVFAESGFEAFCRHAGELRAGGFQFQPGDVLIGIDTDSFSVASAMRRARNSGLHAIGVTNRELTIVDGDVLLYLPGDTMFPEMAGPSILACCMALALLAARLEPGTALASDIASVERAAHTATSEAGRLMASIIFGASSGERIIFAGRGTARWVSSAMARELNNRRAIFAIDADLDDVTDGVWNFDPADMLVRIDPYGDEQIANSQIHGSAKSSPHQVWTFTPQPARSRSIIHIPTTRSPALGTLVAYTALAALLEFADNATIPAS